MLLQRTMRPPTPRLRNIRSAVQPADISPFPSAATPSLLAYN